MMFKIKKILLYPGINARTTSNTRSGRNNILVRSKEDTNVLKSKITLSI